MFNYDPLFEYALKLFLIVYKYDNSGTNLDLDEIIRYKNDNNDMDLD